MNIAKRLSSLHFDGWVHRDLKPGNVLWLPRKQRWTLIDFGLAARVGTVVPASFTPTYAPPEVVRAYKVGTTCIAQVSMDAWAMGVMAFELLTGKPAFEKCQGGTETVCVRGIIFLHFLQHFFSELIAPISRKHDSWHCCCCMLYNSQKCMDYCMVQAVVLCVTPEDR